MFRISSLVYLSALYQRTLSSAGPFKRDKTENSNLNVVLFFFLAIEIDDFFFLFLWLDFVPIDKISTIPYTKDAKKEKKNCQKRQMTWPYITASMRFSIVEKWLPASNFCPRKKKSRPEKMESSFEPQYLIIQPKQLEYMEQKESQVNLDEIWHCDGTPLDE